jgi:prepilin peptidase CpaA
VSSAELVAGPQNPKIVGKPAQWKGPLTDRKDVDGKITDALPAASEIPMMDVIRLFMFPALMAFAASSDLLTMTISNRVSLLLVGGFFLMALVTGMSCAALLSHAGAGLLVLAVTFVFFARGWIGGGDAKLAAATALWLGFDHLLAYLIYASLLGGALTLLLLQFRNLPLPSFFLGQEWAERLHSKHAGVPYGIALAAAALLVYPETPWIKALPF